MKHFLFLTLLFSHFALSAELPKDIQWLTNDKDEEYADPNAKKGGTSRDFMMSFPPTLRTVGPDSANSFASAMDATYLSLIGLHPNTENIIPILATHWAYDKDNKTMYFKINPEAKWSDGKPVIADDFLFTRELALSKNAIDPIKADFYTKEVTDVIKFDVRTLAVVSGPERPRANLHLYLSSLLPTPKHYYGGKIPENFVQKYNWEIPPNCGPYQISEVKKGKSITFTRKKDWWGQNLRYFRGRFNVDKMQYEVIRDLNVAWEYFKNGKLDGFPVVNPVYWHEKSKDPIFENGYVHKLWFYTDSPQSPMGLYLNESNELLKDMNIRLGLAHAINAEKVITTILRNDYMRLDHMFVGYGRYSNEKIKARTFDLKLANEYFDKAGFKQRDANGIRVKDGKKLSFSISYVADNWTPRFVIFKEEARKAGLEFNLQMTDGSAHFKQAQEKKHEITFWSWTTTMRPDYYQLLHSDFANKANNNNITNTADKELDELIDKHRKLMKEDEIIEVGKKIQQKIHDEAMFVPFFAIPYYREAYWKWIKLPKVPGTKLSDASLHYQMMGVEAGGLYWIDQDEEKTTRAAMKAGTKFPPVTIVNTTYKVK